MNALARSKQQIRGLQRSAGPPNAKLGVDLTLDLLLGAAELMRRDQAECYEFVVANLQFFDLPTLKSLYNLLLRRLTLRVPVKALTSLLGALTAPETVTQNRVNFIAALYCESPRQELGDLLVAARLNASQSVYISLVGQPDASLTKLPLSAQINLFRDDLDSLTPPLTVIARQFYHSKSSSRTAELLASLMPLVLWSGQVPLAVQEFALQFSQTFDGQASATLQQLLKIFRYWPKSQGICHIVQLLAAGAKPESALAILPSLCLIQHDYSDGQRLCALALELKGREPAIE